jgi:hypothetical protein
MTDKVQKTIDLTVTKPSLKISQQVMKHGSLVMTFKLSSNHKQWKSPFLPQCKKSCQGFSTAEVPLTVFFHQTGLEHHQSAPQGQAINQHFYLHFHNAVGHIWPQK